jgi:hypothetical protein
MNFDTSKLQELQFTSEQLENIESLGQCEELLKTVGIDLNDMSDEEKEMLLVFLRTTCVNSSTNNNGGSMEMLQQLSNIPIPSGLTMDEEQLEEASQMIGNVLGIDENSAIGDIVGNMVGNIGHSINSGKPMNEILHSLGQQFNQELSQQITNGTINQSDIAQIKNQILQTIENPVEMLKQMQKMGKPQETAQEARNRRKRERIIAARKARRRSGKK